MTKTNVQGEHTRHLINGLSQIVVELVLNVYSVNHKIKKWHHTKCLVIFLTLSEIIARHTLTNGRLPSMP